MRLSSSVRGEITVSSLKLQMESVSYSSLSFFSVLHLMMSSGYM